MKLKYADFIDQFNNCIAADCSPVNREAFRWTFDQVTDERNFIPRYLNPTYPDKKKMDCIGYALSMFDTEEQARLKFNTLQKDRGQIYKMLGTHVAKGDLTLQDGISGESSLAKNNHGHFSFFEFEETDLSEKFIIINKLSHHHERA